jgi:hypothetical protein
MSGLRNGSCERKTRQVLERLQCLESTDTQAKMRWSHARASFIRSPSMIAHSIEMIVRRAV